MKPESEPPRHPCLDLVKSLPNSISRINLHHSRRSMESTTIVTALLKKPPDRSEDGDCKPLSDDQIIFIITDIDYYYPKA